MATGDREPAHVAVDPPTFFPAGRHDPAMTALEGAVDQFLADADDVFAEYEQGYVDADAAMSMLEASIEELRAAAEN